jgi:hypothetical protein
VTANLHAPTHSVVVAVILPDMYFFARLSTTDPATDSAANKKQPAHSSSSHNDNGNSDQLSDSHDNDLQKHSLVDIDDNDTASDMDESIDADDIAIDIIDDGATADDVIKAECASSTNTGIDSDYAEDGLAMIEHKVNSA